MKKIFEFVFTFLLTLFFVREWRDNGLNFWLFIALNLCLHGIRILNTQEGYEKGLEVATEAVHQAMHNAMDETLSKHLKKTIKFLTTPKKDE